MINMELLNNFQLFNSLGGFLPSILFSFGLALTMLELMVGGVFLLWFGFAASKHRFNKSGAILPASPLYDLYFFIRTRQIRFNSFISLCTVLWLMLKPLLCNSVVMRR